MRLFIDGDEVTIEELKQILDNLEYGEFDGSSYEIITLDHISMCGDLYFETERHSVFG